MMVVEPVTIMLLSRWLAPLFVTKKLYQLSLLGVKIQAGGLAVTSIGGLIDDKTCQRIGNMNQAVADQTIRFITSFSIFFFLVFSFNTYHYLVIILIRTEHATMTNTNRTRAIADAYAT